MHTGPHPDMSPAPPPSHPPSLSLLLLPTDQAETLTFSLWFTACEGGNTDERTLLTPVTKLAHSHSALAMSWLLLHIAIHSVLITALVYTYYYLCFLVCLVEESKNVDILIFCPEALSQHWCLRVFSFHGLS